MSGAAVGTVLVALGGAWSCDTERAFACRGECLCRTDAGVTSNGRVLGWVKVCAWPAEENAECMGVCEAALVAAESGSTASQTRDGVEARAGAIGCTRDAAAPYCRSCSSRVSSISAIRWRGVVRGAGDGRNDARDFCIGVEKGR